MNTIIHRSYFDGHFGIDSQDQPQDEDIQLIHRKLWAAYVDFQHCFEDGFDGHDLLIGATVVDDFLHLYVKLAHPYRDNAYRLAPNLEAAVLEWAAEEGLAGTRYGVRYDLCFPKPL